MVVDLNSQLTVPKRSRRPSLLPSKSLVLALELNHMVDCSSSLEWQHTWVLPAYFAAAAVR